MSSDDQADDLAAERAEQDAYALLAQREQAAREGHLRRVDACRGVFVARGLDLPFQPDQFEQLLDDIVTAIELVS